MNRIIKFRAWDKLAEEMQPPFSPFAVSAYNNPDNFVFMQFTGLLDKNGKEIYEGDIVTSESRDDMRVVTTNRTVSFEDGAFIATDKNGYIPLDEYHIDMKNVEVIGNIYENPELLKAKS